MWQMSMKLPAMFDQNPPHTFDKIVKKLITTKNALKPFLKFCASYNTNPPMEHSPPSPII